MTTHRNDNFLGELPLAARPRAPDVEPQLGPPSLDPEVHARVLAGLLTAVAGLAARKGDALAAREVRDLGALLHPAPAAPAVEGGGA